MCVKAEEVEGNAEGSGPAAASLLQSQSELCSAWKDLRERQPFSHQQYFGPL